MVAMLVGRDIKAVIPFVQIVEINATIGIGLSLNDKSSCVDIFYLYRSIFYIGMFSFFITIDGILIAHTNMEVSFAFAHHFNIEMNGYSITVSTIDGKTTFLDSVDIFIASCEAKHNSCALAFLERRNILWCHKTDKG